jgi:hypothetical protein
VIKLFTILIVGSGMMFYPVAAGAQQAASDVEGVIAAAYQPQPDPQAQQARAQAQPQPQPQGQGNVPQTAQRAEAQAKSAARRFNLGVQGGVGLDPEIVDVGVHGSFGPIFDPNLAFRPVLELGFGEVTTLLALNFDVIYTFAGNNQDGSWTPYFGAGPQIGLSHQGFETEDTDNVEGGTEEQSRFDFSDTDFNGGMNFIVGMKRQSGAFFEMKATAWGVSTIRLLVGFNFYGRRPTQ